MCQRLIFTLNLNNKRKIYQFVIFNKINIVVFLPRYNRAIIQYLPVTRPSTCKHICLLAVYRGEFFSNILIFLVLSFLIFIFFNLFVVRIYQYLALQQLGLVLFLFILQQQDKDY